MHAVNSRCCPQRGFSNYIVIVRPLIKCMGVLQEFFTLLQNLGVCSLSACEALDTASVFTVEVTPCRVKL